MKSAESFKIGVDVGGTFTDITLVGSDGAITVHKTPSTPEAPAQAVLTGIGEALHAAGRQPRDCVGFVHGSTIGVNTIIRRDGASVGLILTAGFEDILELGRCKMPDPFSLFSARPLPLARRNFVRGVRERIDGNGRIVTPLDLDGLGSAAQELVDGGARVLAILFLHAYRNPAHENQARQYLASLFPDLSISISSEIWPQIREYERATVLVMNSYIAPRVTQYLAELNDHQDRLGLGCPLYMTSSNGGVVPLSHAAAQPISTLLSGPSSGVIATLSLMRDSGIERAITMDMGGTSADLCVLEGDHVPYAWDQEISGLPIMLPSIDVSSIGSGGGSIAYTDNLGLLKVGPQSAGADPGPVAYGRNGTRPTITDAYLISGFIDADQFLGGGLKLHVEKARAAMQELGRPLKLGAEAAADGVLKVATSSLVAEFTRLAAKKGLDVREFVMIPFGGAGATHACLVADELQIPRIAIPYSPGTFCATGAILSDFRLDYVKNVFSPLDSLDASMVEGWFAEIERRGRETLLDSLQEIKEIKVLRAAGVRYRSQGFEVPVAFDTLDRLPELFSKEYGRLYGPRTDDGPLDVVSLRGTVVGITAKPALSWVKDQDGDAPVSKRKIILDGKAVECPAYRRAGLTPGWKGDGPFVVDQPDTTCVVTMGWKARVDAMGTLHLNKEF